MNEWISDLHWLRPEWFWALIPSILAFILLWRMKHTTQGWQSIIDPELLNSMTQHSPVPSKGVKAWPLTMLALGWIIGIFGLAGPSWEKLPVPASTNEDALIIALDLSYSMLAEDVKPSRIERTKFKINDILQHRGDGYTALIAYAGGAHVVSPLTQDTNTVRNLLNPLNPLIMPAPGSRPDKALALAQELRQQSELPRARVLLITDEIIDKDIERIEKLSLTGLSIQVLAVGTQAGAPINIPNRGFLRNRAGDLILPTLQFDAVEELAEALDGRAARLQTSDQDWRYLLPEDVQLSQPERLDDKRTFDHWRDAGVWMTLGLLPLALLAFRRGWLFVFLIGFLLPYPNNSQALSWEDLWHTPDQQGSALYQQNEPEKAAERFKDPAWKGTAHFSAGQYEEALSNWEGLETTPETLFNRGNALAKLQRLEEAIESYDQALALKSPFPQAQENRDYLQSLLDQQQEQQSDQSSDNQQNSDQNQSSKDQNSNQNGQPNSDPNQQGSEQQKDSEQQSSEQASSSSEQNDSSKGSQQNQKNQDGQAQESQGANDPSSSQASNSGDQQEASEQAGSNAKDSATDAESDIQDAVADSNKPEEALDLRALEKDAQEQQTDEQKAQDQQAQEQQAQTGQNQTGSSPNGQTNSETNDPSSGADEKRPIAVASQDPLKDKLNPEEYQALQQWLNRVPEDPSGLLERKFLYEYKKRQMENAEQESKVW